MKKYIFILILFFIYNNELLAQQSDYPANQKIITTPKQSKLVRTYLTELKLSITYEANRIDTVSKEVVYKQKKETITIVFKNNYGSCLIKFSDGSTMNFIGNKKLYHLIPITHVDEMGKIAIKKVKEYIPKKK